MENDENNLLQNREVVQRNPDILEVVDLNDEVELQPEVIVVSNQNSDVHFLPPTANAGPSESNGSNSHSVKKRKSRSRSKSQTPKKKGNPIIRVDDDDDGTTCPICLDQWEISGTHRLTSLKCGHLFGYSCIKRWLHECMPGEKSCPSCKSRCTARDLRFIYAKRICAVDNSEKDRLIELLTTEKTKNFKLESDCSMLKLELTVTKNQVIKLEEDFNRLQNVMLTRTSTNDLFSIPARSLYSYRLFMEKNIEISKEPGCRVMAFGRKCQNLIVSQKSTQSLFPGYGVRFIDTKTFRPTNFIHMSSNQVRDLCFNASEDLLISATNDKCAKLFNIHDRTVVNVFTPTDKSLWSCALDKDTNNFLYLGSQHGITYVYDVRNSNTILEEFKIDSDMSPVINICPIPISNGFPFGGFLICKLQSVWFYEYLASQKVTPTKLNVNGPFISMSYESTTNMILIATRPSKQHIQSRYILGNLQKINDITIFDIKSTVFGSQIQPVMSRCTQICVKENTLIAGYLHDMKLLSLWDIVEQTRIQSLPCSDVVYDTCPIYDGDKIYLAALTECKCRIYQVITSSK